MFFELQEVQKIQTGISNLIQVKENLDRKILEAFSSNPQRIDSSLKNTLQTVLDDSERSLYIMKEIEDEVEMGYFVPSKLNLDQLVYDSSQLPEWFEFVFDKEFQKQKKNLDALSKKTYKMLSLPQVKHSIDKEIQSFRLLVQRYQVLTHKEKNSLNIMGEAEILTVKCKSAKQKYNNFCKSIAIKIVSFLQQSVTKSMNFSNSMNSIGQTVTNSFNVKLQPDQFQRTSITNKFRQPSNFYQTQGGFNRHKMMKSVDFNAKSINGSVDLNGKTMYGRLNNDFSRTNNQWGGRYVPKYANQTSFDFYHR